MNNFKWTKRKIGTIVLIAFVTVFLIISLLPESLFVNVPQLRLTRAGKVYSSHIYPNTPPISYRFELTFTATGTFSVNNPVHVKVILKNMNISNFLDYFCGVTFTNAYTYPIEYHEDFPMNSVIIYLKNNGDGTYSGQGDVVWLVEGSTYISEVINNPLGHTVPISMYENASSVLTISSVSDTLTLHFTASTARLAWQIGSFSIIVLQPVFEAILLKDKKQV